MYHIIYYMYYVHQYETSEKEKTYILEKENTYILQGQLNEIYSTKEFSKFLILFLNEL